MSESRELTGPKKGYETMILNISINDGILRISLNVADSTTILSKYISNIGMLDLADQLQDASLMIRAAVAARFMESV